MNEQDLIDLGFKKMVINRNDSILLKFHYYIYEFNNGFYLMSNDSDVLIDGKWCVGLFDIETLQISSKEDVKTLINIIKRNE